MDQPAGGILPRHTTMPARLQKTPFGDVTLTSRWMRDRYLLHASGPTAALRWMFPNHPNEFEKTSSTRYRHDFVPSERQVTVERDLRRVCAQWQEHWDNKLLEGPAPTTSEVSTPEERTDLTMLQLFERYQIARTGELAQSTMERNRHYLARWAQVLGDNLLIKDLTEEQLAASRTKLAQKLEASTVNCAFALIRTVFRWATKRGWMSDASYMNIRKLRETNSARDKAWWTIPEVDIALRVAGEVDMELWRHRENPNQGTATLLIALGCLIGLRYEEIIMLRWQDLDLDSVDQATGLPSPVAHIVPREGWTPKSGEARAIPIHDRLASILKTYRRPDGFVLSSHKAMPKRGGTKRVYRYDPKKIWNMVLAKAVAAGLKPITPHGMRHSFASNLLMAKVNEVLVARWLGHADTTMLHKTYGHLLAYHGDINLMSFGDTPTKGLPPRQE